MESLEVVSWDLYLPEVVKCGNYLFADDTKIFRQITTNEDVLLLQSDINSLEQRSQKWLLTFHPKKRHIMTLGKFYNIAHTQKYTLHRQELEHVFEQKDLGIILYAELKFDEHISVKVKKVSAIAGLIRITFSYFDGLLFKKLLTTFVRPHLEYGQVTWTLRLKKYITILEKVQRRAAKLVDGFHHMSYSVRLKKLNLPSLVHRIARGDMIEIFKHFHSYNCPNRKNDYQLV